MKLGTEVGGERNGVGWRGGDKYFEKGKAFQLHQETSTRKSIKAL